MRLTNSLNNIKPPSISQEYSLCAVVISVLVGIVLSLTVLYSTILRDKEKQVELEQTIRTVDNALSLSIDGTYREMQSIAGKLLRSEEITPEAIEYLFSRSFILEADLNAEALFFWPRFRWIDQQGNETVNSDVGVLEQPIPIKDRRFVYDATHSPYVLHFADPVINMRKQSYMLPATMGIRDKHNHYVGAMATQFDIKDMIKNIRSVLPKEVGFVILDKEYHVIVSDIEIVANSEQPLVDFAAFDPTQGVVFKAHHYTHSLASSTYPFTIFVGYHTEYFTQQLLLSLKHYGVIAIVLGVCSMGVLFWFFWRNITPVVVLSRIANHIANRAFEKEKIHFPNMRNKAVEIRFLHVRIREMYRLVRMEHIRKKALEEANIRAAESYQAQEEFLSKVNHELRTPLNSIKGFATMMQEEPYGMLQQKYKDYLDDILKCTEELESMMVSIINPTYINIYDCMDTCLKIQMNMADMINRVAVEYHIEEGLPEFYGDELRIKQMIVGLMHRSLKHTYKGGNITINITLYQKQEIAYLHIIVQDTSFGLSEEEMEKLIGEFDTEGITRRTDGRDLKYTDIKKIVALHHGTFHIESKKHEGSTITILLPYRSEEDIEMKGVVGSNVVRFQRDV